MTRATSKTVRGKSNSNPDVVLELMASNAMATRALPRAYGLGGRAVGSGSAGA